MSPQAGHELNLCMLAFSGPSGQRVQTACTLSNNITIGDALLPVLIGLLSLHDTELHLPAQLVVRDELGMMVRNCLVADLPTGWDHPTLAVPIGVRQLQDGAWPIVRSAMGCSLHHTKMSSVELWLSGFQDSLHCPEVCC